MDHSLDKTRGDDDNSNQAAARYERASLNVNEILAKQITGEDEILALETDRLYHEAELMFYEFLANAGLLDETDYIKDYRPLFHCVMFANKKEIKKFVENLGETRVTELDLHHREKLGEQRSHKKLLNDLYNVCQARIFAFLLKTKKIQEMKDYGEYKYSQLFALLSTGKINSDDLVRHFPFESISDEEGDLDTESYDESEVSADRPSAQVESLNREATTALLTVPTWLQVRIAAAAAM